MHRFPLRRLVALAGVVLAGVLLAGACGNSNEAATSTPGSLGVASSGATGTGTEPTPRTTLPPALDPEPITWRSCGPSLECGTVTVPLDYAEPTGPSLDLAVARRPATDPSSRIGSLFVHPGGPGASGIEYLRGGLGRAYGEHFDVVAWDPRGVGDSGHLGCRDEVEAQHTLDPDPSTPDGQAALDTAAQAAAAACGSSAGAVLTHLDATVNARDLDQLRRAVGDDTLNLVGQSYGTLVGLEYARLFPDRVRALVLDGVVDPGAALEAQLTAQTDAIESAIDERFARCEGAPVDATCPLDDPGAAYDRLAARVRVEPLPAGSNGVLGPDQLAFAAISATYGGDDDTVTLLQGLADADRRGDGTVLARLAAGYGAGADTDAYLAVTCADGPHPTGTDAWEAFADRLAARSARFGAAVANEVLPCAFWTVAPTRQPSPVTAPGLPPTLVIGTTGDAATPYADAQAVATQLAGAVLLTYEGIGHTASNRSACVSTATRSYLFELTLPPPGTVCR